MAVREDDVRFLRGSVATCGHHYVRDPAVVALDDEFARPAGRYALALPRQFQRAFHPAIVDGKDLVADPNAGQLRWAGRAIEGREPGDKRSRLTGVVNTGSRLHTQ